MVGSGAGRRAGNGKHDAGPAWTDVVRVAGNATVDPKTVRRYLDGEPMRSTTRARVELGLKSCGLEVYVRKAAG